MSFGLAMVLLTAAGLLLDDEQPGSGSQKNSDRLMALAIAS
jgi:hypothetical protein